MLAKSIRIPLLNAAHWWLAVTLCSVSFNLSAQVLPAADLLPAPAGRVLLTITGNIGITNSGTNRAMGQAEQAEFDLELLDSLPQHEFSTETPWTHGAHRFSGVLLTDLLQRVAAHSTLIKAKAFNEYFSEFDADRPELRSLLLTTRIDGQPLRIRDKGPTWLMLPLSDLKQLNNKRYHELLIWQLRTLDVE